MLARVEAGENSCPDRNDFKCTFAFYVYIRHNEDIIVFVAVVLLRLFVGSDFKCTFVNCINDFHAKLAFYVYSEDIIILLQ